MLFALLLLVIQCYDFDWNTVTIDITSGYYITDVSYGNNTFIIGADDIYYSYDAEEWNKVNANLSSIPIRSIKYGYNDNDIPIWVGCSGSYNMIYSYNMIDWYKGNTPNDLNSAWSCVNIVSGRVCPIDDMCHNIFIATTTNSILGSNGMEYLNNMYSYDGITWLLLSNTGYVQRAIAYGNVSYDNSSSGIFVGGNYGSQCSTYYSYDGINWNYNIYNTALYYVRQIEYGMINGSDYMFITYIVDTTTYGYSYNGIDWYFNTIANKSSIGSVVFGYDIIDDVYVPMVIMVGDYYSQYSYNGIDWYQFTEQNIHKQVTTSTNFKSVYGLATDFATSKSYGIYVFVHTDNSIMYAKLPQSTVDDSNNDLITNIQDILHTSDDDNKLSTGAIIGIVIACVVVITGITVGVIFGVKNKSKKRRVVIRSYRP